MLMCSWCWSWGHFSSISAGWCGLFATPRWAALRRSVRLTSRWWNTLCDHLPQRTSHGLLMWSFGTILCEDDTQTEWRFTRGCWDYPTELEAAPPGTLTFPLETLYCSPASHRNDTDNEAKWCIQSNCVVSLQVVMVQRQWCAAMLITNLSQDPDALGQCFQFLPHFSFKLEQFLK